MTDSGGSYQMTPWRVFLYDFRKFSCSISLGDGRTCAIKGTCKVKIQRGDGTSFVLDVVRYIPDLKRNLILPSTLEKGVYSVKM